MFTQEENERPKIVGVHQKLLDELKIRERIFEKETGRPTWGRRLIFSEMAAMELKAIRESGDKITKEILLDFKDKELPIKKIEIGNELVEYVPYEIFKKLFNMVSILSRKKDQAIIQLDVTKIKGLKKNEIICFWK